MVALTLLPVRLSLLSGDGEDIVGILLVATDVGATGVPNEVLEELVCVLLLHHEARSLDDVADVADELLAIGAELLDVDEGVVADV